MGEKRPTIPEKIKRQLWVKAGGRCEFRGCNKYLFGLYLICFLVVLLLHLQKDNQKTYQI